MVELAAFVTLTWASASTVNPADICMVFSGMLDVNSRPIYFRELDSKNDTHSSNDSDYSEYLENERKIEALERRASELREALERWGQYNLPEWDPVQKGNRDTCDEIAPDQPLRMGD